MTLETLFTQIADAIRSKTGSSDAIPAQSMPAAIAAIQTGGNGDGFDPAGFGSYYVSRFLAVYGDAVSFHISTDAFPTLPKLIVVPTVQDTDINLGGSFVMIRDDTVGYRLFFNGQELEVTEYHDNSEGSYFSMDMSFNYEHPLKTLTNDESEKAMYWF